MSKPFLFIFHYLKSTNISPKIYFILLIFICTTLPYERLFSPRSNYSNYFSVAQAKKKKRKKRREYDRRQRAAKKLIDAGHPTVEITLKTKPKVKAVVYHGKEKLGTTPLRLTWPKDTGSLDIKLKAKGYLTVNSRLYTHRNDRVTVKMFKTDQAHLLFGYKKKVKSDEDTETNNE